MRTTVPTRAVFVAVSLLAMGGNALAADEPGIASGWIKETATQARLIAGGVSGPSGKKVYAGIEIRLDDGWKTYWRHPGSSGVPPRFEWTGSGNLAKATVHFPAPHRFPDADGDTIGYKHAVVLPVEIEAKSPGEPVELKLQLEYGVCKDVCVPVEAKLELLLPPDAAKRPGGTTLAGALDRVPRSAAARAGKDPVAERVSVELAGAKPQIVIDARFPGSDEAADVFLEAPDGAWIPLAKPVDGAPAGLRRFLVDLTDGADLDDLKGKSIRLTLVGSDGQSETSFTFQ